MKRRTLFILAAFGLLGTLIALVWTIWPARGPETIVLDDADVESVIAEIFKVDGVTNDIPPTKVPTKYLSSILKCDAGESNHGDPSRIDQR